MNKSRETSHWGRYKQGFSVEISTRPISSKFTWYEDVGHNLLYPQNVADERKVVVVDNAA